MAADPKTGLADEVDSFPLARVLSMLSDDEIDLPPGDDEAFRSDTVASSATSTLDTDDYVRHEDEEEAPKLQSEPSIRPKLNTFIVERRNQIKELVQVMQMSINSLEYVEGCGNKAMFRMLFNNNEAMHAYSEFCTLKQKMAEIDVVAKDGPTAFGYFSTTNPSVMEALLPNLKRWLRDTLDLAQDDYPSLLHLRNFVLPVKMRCVYAPDEYDGVHYFRLNSLLLRHSDLLKISQAILVRYGIESRELPQSRGPGAVKFFSRLTNNEDSYQRERASLWQEYFQDVLNIANSIGEPRVEKFLDRISSNPAFDVDDL